MGKKQFIAFDLSLSNTGWAVGEVEDGELDVIDFGSIRTTRFSKYTHGFRLNYLAEEISKLYKKYPEADAVIKEGSFSNGHIRSTQIIFKVVGVWELITHLRGHTGFTDIAPSSVKKELTGNGRAKKFEVEDKVIELTGVQPKNEDQADAIAVLIAYCRQEGLIHFR